MHILELMLVGLAIAAASSPKAETRGDDACSKLVGVEDISKIKTADFIIFGETHGTTELPQAFSDLVCQVSTNQPVIVAVEFLPVEQRSLDEFLRSDGGVRATSALLSSYGWSDPHGRASKAMLDLLQNLRRRIAAGTDLTVVAFDHPSEQPGTSATREQGMARNLVRAKQQRPEAKIMALTGGAHAGKSPITSFGPSFPSMAQLLPKDATFSITFRRAGGEAWGCRAITQGTTPECKPWPGTVREAVVPKGIVLDTSREGFNAVVSVGQPYTASPPARSDLAR